MKTKFLFIAALLTTSFSYGQITIKAEDGLIPFEKLPYTYIKNRGIAFPDIGENVVWDYSHFVPCDNCESIIEFKSNKDKNRVNSDYYIGGNIKVLGFSIPTNEYYGVNQNGDFYRTGVKYNSKILPLKRLTGHPMDRLKIASFDTQTSILEYDFPFEYGKKWQTKNLDTMYFTLNAPSVNLKNVDIKQISKDSVFQSIVGYGKLKLPHFENGKVKIFTYDALLLKKIAHRKITIQSDLEEEQLIHILGLAGLEKNDISTCVSYKFYIRELPLFVLYMSDCSGKGTIQSIRMRTNLEAHLPKSE